MELSTITMGITAFAGVSTILKVAWYIINYAANNIVKPLSLSIDQLQRTTKELKALIDSVRSDQQQLNTRITVIEQAIKTIKTQVDTLWNMR